MQTQTEEQFPQKGLVTEWFPEKGFGFVAIGGERIFVHVSKIYPWHERGVNLKGKTLVVHSTEDSPKGRRVSCADTLEEYEKRETERAEESRKKALAEMEKLRVKSGLQDLLDRRSVEYFREIEKDPQKFFLAWNKPTLKEGVYVLESTTVHKCADVLSTEDNNLTVRVFFTVSVCASCQNPHVWVMIPAEEYGKFSFVTGGVSYASLVSKSDPLKGVAMALHREDIREKEERKYAHQLAGVVEGLKRDSLEHVVSPHAVLKGWPTAGDYFRQITGGFHTPIRWVRDYRQKMVEEVLDTEAEKYSVETIETWYEAPSWDPNYDDELYGGDGMKGLGGYVGGGKKSERHGWAKDMVARICAADEEDAFKSDLQTLSALELRSRLEKLDADTLARKGHCVSEGDFFLPENKIRCARKCIADWVRDFRKNPNAYINGWSSTPNVENLELAEKVTILSGKIKGRLLAKQQVLIEKTRLEDVAKVRKNWRDMLTWGHRSLSRSGLHQDALNLLEKIRVAQNRAGDLAGPRRWEMERRSYELLEQTRREAEEEAILKKEEESEQFLSQGAWSALDKFGFK